MRLGDAAVSEVVGFILMFALSVVILVVSMQAFNVIRDSSRDLSDASELRLFAVQVASEAALFGKVSNDFPNATFESVIRAPEVQGRDYYVRATNKTIFANTTDGKIRVNSTTFRLEAISNLFVSGEVTPTGGLVKVVYAFDAGANKKTITVKSG
ncbi:MAG: hypothetical protein HY556_06960 [Euryarchaeota archaeon]|nr:hypothetical protein [Euryarchaeota archaeon]